MLCSNLACSKLDPFRTLRRGPKTFRVGSLDERYLLPSLVLYLELLRGPPLMCNSYPLPAIYSLFVGVVISSIHFYQSALGFMGRVVGED